ncbi:MAG: LysR family transcriptional regulator [Myxococcota bacterium]|nr:LysR family transcriptional regulator [Deltaproteobacteria bacterium]MDQ3341539.1 LysR family transcriptional regulator [Myxococcota bacterium]
MARTEASVANLEVFCKTFELGNFTRAAVDLGLTPQAASRALARLEEHLGTTLFRRTTRKLEPTEAGRTYYARCRQALDLLATGERELAAEHADRGIVRISVGTPWGHHQLVPALARLARVHPNIDVVVQIDNRNIDFVRDGFDCAIRLGEIRDQTLVARKLGEHALGLYASPAYLAERPAPRRVADLAQHRCIGFVMPGSGRVLPWELATGDVTPVMSFTVQGDVLGTITLAREGAGIVQTYDFAVMRERARGELVEVLPSARGATRQFSLLYPKGVVQTPAVRKVVAFLVADAKR